MIIFESLEEQAEYLNMVVEVQVKVSDLVALRVAQNPLRETDDGDITLEDRALDHLVAGALSRRLNGPPGSVFNDGLTIAGTGIQRRQYNAETGVLQELLLHEHDTRLP